jgi:hypothetical protein
VLDEIDLAVTVRPLGAIFRLEHARDGFEEDRERYRQRLAEYQRRLSSYQSRQAGTFAFADELAEKRGKLRRWRRPWRNPPAIMLGRGVLLPDPLLLTQRLGQLAYVSVARFSR